MKKIVALLLMLLMPICASAGDLPRIGVLVYNASDAFISDVYRSIATAAEGKAELVYRDSENSQILQNEQVDALLKEGVDALILNAVDRTSAVYLIRMVMPYGVPVVFNNREPLLEDLRLYDKAFYVGNNPKESGSMSGQLIADYFRAHPEADRHNDGVQYIMLKGEPGHQDAELRTVYSVKAISDAGIELHRLQEVTALWDRAIAQEKMAGLIASYGDRIDCVISNNDEMALGAIEALKAAGLFSDGRYVPVVGVDATAAAREALAEGTLLGTVLNDADAQGTAALSLALLLAEKGTIAGSEFERTVDQEKFIWTPSRIITRETLHDDVPPG